MNPIEGDNFVEDCERPTVFPNRHVSINISKEKRTISLLNNTIKGHTS